MAPGWGEEHKAGVGPVRWNSASSVGSFRFKAGARDTLGMRVLSVVVLTLGAWLQLRGVPVSPCQGAQPPSSEASCWTEAVSRGTQPRPPWGTGPWPGPGEQLQPPEAGPTASPLWSWASSVGSRDGLSFPGCLPFPVGTYVLKKREGLEKK